MIVRNERYIGRVHWNVSEWQKDPDTGKRTRRMCPRSAWITHTDERLRIVSDELFERAQRRMQPAKAAVARSGGRPKYLLSGLLRCDTCNAHYIGVNGHEYGCSSHRDGGDCSNATRVRRELVEHVLLDPIRKDLLSPDRIARMAKEMQAHYLAHRKAASERALEAPKELQGIDARLQRLRERVVKGDPDLTADELQAAVEVAEAKRRELLDQQPGAKQSAKVLAVLPKAAELYRRQIAQDLVAINAQRSKPG